MGYSFTQKQCIKSLLKIGFSDASTRRSKHYKYKLPENCQVNCERGIRPFITAPKHKFFCQDAIVSEVNKLCGEEVKQKFLDNL